MAHAKALLMFWTLTIILGYYCTKFENWICLELQMVVSQTDNGTSNTEHKTPSCLEISYLTARNTYEVIND